MYSVVQFYESGKRESPGAFTVLAVNKQKYPDVRKIETLRNTESVSNPRQQQKAEYDTEDQ